MNRLFSVFAGLLLGMAVSVASAQYITGVTIESFSSQFDNRVATNTLSDIGFDVVTGVHTANFTHMWLTNGSYAQPFDPLPASIVFDLGVEYDLDTLSIWNYNEVNFTARGANLVDISVGVDPDSLTSLGEFNFTQAPGVGDVDFRQDIEIDGLANTDSVRYVSFDILTNHPGGDASFAGLSKVRFSGTALGVAGDVNGDMLVDEADFTIINGNMFQEVDGGVSDGDFNQDNIVDFYDYKFWKNIVDAQPAGLVSGTAVPEPATVVMGLLAVALASLCRDGRAACR